MATTNARMRLRRDTAANWTASNKIMEVGEWGYETDTDRIKMGDGATVWTSLRYWTPKYDIISAYSTAVGPSFTGTATTMPITASRVTSATVYALGSNMIRVTPAGTYEVHADLVLELASGSSNNGAEAWIEVMNAELTGSRMGFMMRSDGPTSASFHGFLVLAANDEVRIRAIRTAGGATFQSAANGVRLSMRRIYEV